MNTRTTVRELHRRIASSYGVDESKFLIRTSYCLPDGNTVTTLGRTPYFNIVKDSEVSEFLRKFKEYSGLNMLVSFEVRVNIQKNGEGIYDSQELDYSQLLKYVEVVEASYWKKRPRDDDILGQSGKINGIDGGNSSLGLTEETQLIGNTTLDYTPQAEGGRGMPTLDSSEGDISTQFSPEFYELARLAEMDDVKNNDVRGVGTFSKECHGHNDVPCFDLGIDNFNTGDNNVQVDTAEHHSCPRMKEKGVKEDLLDSNDNGTIYGTQEFVTDGDESLNDTDSDGEEDIIDSQENESMDSVDEFVTDGDESMYVTDSDGDEDIIDSPEKIRIDEVDTDADYVTPQSQADVDNASTQDCYTEKSSEHYKVFGRSESSMASESTYGGDFITGIESNLELANTTIYKGRVFETKDDMYMCLSVYAVENTFCFKVDKSDKSRWVAVCVDRNCQWRVRAVSVNQTDSFVVTKTVMEHTCDVSSRARYVKKATAAVIGKLMQSKYADGKRGPRAVDLMDLVFEQLKVNISYMKAWNIKEIAVTSARGTPEQSYMFLSTYLHLLNITNPGSITDIVTSTDKDGNRQFKYLFMALGACIKGFQFLRKVIVIDGTHLKGKYKGCLVSASGQDANLQIFPLAFGVVDSENEDSWVWFLQKLSLFAHDSSNLVFVSDRHNAIYAALKRVYPNSHHGACTVHLWRNVKALFKSKGLATAMSKAARSYTIGDFKYWWEEIKKRSPACCTYLSKIGVEHWALCYFKGQRYNLMSSNIAESLNNAMRKAVDFPIVSMLEFLRTMLMGWFAERKELSCNCKTRCPPRIERVLMSQFVLSTTCSVRPCSRNVFQVTNKHGHVFTVDLHNKSCTCKAFDTLKLPCPHAIAASSRNKVDVYVLVDRLYLSHAWKKVYEEQILPLPRGEDIDIPEEIKGLALFPPSVLRPSGRPRALRIASSGEDTAVTFTFLFVTIFKFSWGIANIINLALNFYVQFKGRRCTRCGLQGHNRVTCKNAI